jgi:hypothetical protein
MSVGECEGMNPHTLKWISTLGIGISMDSQIFKGNCKGQITLDWKVPYISGKLLELKYLKWARMTHLGIWNRSYGQKKGRESNCQFDSQPLKVKNRPNLLMFKWRATYHWKTFDKGYNFASNLFSIRVFTRSYGLPKLQELGISGLPTWECQDKMTFGFRPCG